MRWLFLLFVLEGCALTSKATPVEIRYFSPEQTAARAAPRHAHEKVLRLGRITSSANLRSRIVRRESSVELSQYETLRWTENPEAYVRRSLARALFEEGEMEQGLASSLPTLDVELVAFEEVHLEKKHSGRVELRYQLRRDIEILASGSIVMEKDVTGEGIEPVVAAIGRAMDDASADLAKTIATRLENRVAIESAH